MVIKQTQQGVFTTFLVCPPAPVWCLEAHYQRLKEACDFFGYACPWGVYTDFEIAVSAFIQENIHGPTVLRLALLPNNDAASEVTVQFAMREPPEQEPVRAIWCQFDRPYPAYKQFQQPLIEPYLEEAKRCQANEFIRLSMTGSVSEASYANVFIVCDDTTLRTPCVEEAGCLPGIVRQGILDTAMEEGMTVEVGHVSPAMVQAAQGVLVTNAVRGIRPVVSVAEHTFDVAKMTPVIQRLNRALVQLGTF